MGDLVTNAKKVTVSVLYWYEKLSSLLTEIFNMILKRIKKIHSFLFIGNSRPGVGGLPGLAALAPPTVEKSNFPHHHSKSKTDFCIVSRLACPMQDANGGINGETVDEFS